MYTLVFTTLIDKLVVYFKKKKTPPPGKLSFLQGETCISRNLGKFLKESICNRKLNSD